jgi:hypothetical protein
VNSYNDVSSECAAIFVDNKKKRDVVQNAAGFKTIYKPKVGGFRFADLLQVTTFQGRLSLIEFSFCGGVVI